MIKGPGNNDKTELVARSTISDYVHGKEDSVSHDGLVWKKVNSTVNWVGQENKHWISLGGSSNRERLFFNENSDIIQKLKEKARIACANKSIPEVLGIVNTLINSITAREGITSSNVEKMLDGELEQYLSFKKLHTGNLDVDMDELIKQKILVCRHKGLLAASILGHLVENKVLPAGNVRQYRSTLMKGKEVIGAHTWAVYRDSTTGNLWMCDPRWRTARNVTTQFEALALKGYGEQALNAMIKRLDQEDGIQSFAEKINVSKNIFPLIKDAYFSAGTVSSPGNQIRLELEKSDNHLIALDTALKKHKINSEIKTHPNPFFIIRSENNPGLFTLDFEKFSQDYQDILAKLNDQDNVVVLIANWNEKKSDFSLAQDITFDDQNINLLLNDQPGVFAALCTTLTQHGISFTSNTFNNSIAIDKKNKLTPRMLETLASTFSINLKQEIEKIEKAKKEIQIQRLPFEAAVVSTKDYHLNGFEVYSKRGQKLDEFRMDQSIIVLPKETPKISTKPWELTGFEVYSKQGEKLSEFRLDQSIFTVPCRAQVQCNEKQDNKKELTLY